MAPAVYWTPTMRTRPSAPVDAKQSLEEMAPIPTPPSVRDVTPSLCLSLVEFKDMLRQFRAVDDSVTLRLNRAFAHSRDRGTSLPPSLLMQHDKSYSSSTATDLGRSTYSSVSETMCASIWLDLVDLWTRREDTIKYCMEINAQQAQQAQAAQAPINKEDLLDLDRAQARERSAPIEISRSRGESTAEFMARQLRNELMVESIVRRRSLEGTGRS
ncbi:unnamed protein product [Malassezia sympodialis ATCC 42132]|uniref:uncharacterized protein n=1 Tax=Malassezia sympodialis (strain ATCC 42132) TaxID=1230383 RepID=UPI0002C1DF5A|nr:uncharacterized protein MSY001_1777 [Malassezia sympodialis ATCC 42132]CCU99071.1 unnamed protein product [Malassezia sympodialis ATCC 42132]|eukprot:XP_018740339.1 uncharacterized protein MSY001_1777 [Malassezia sympodialis ATCC 42132]